MDILYSKLLHGQIGEFVGILKDRSEAPTARLAPSDEPLQWSADFNKLVRLDHAIMAIHVLSARLAFRSLPAMMRQKVFAFKVSLVQRVLKWIAARAIGKEILRPLAQFFWLFDVIQADEVQKEVEATIRRQSIRLMREFHSHSILPQRPAIGKRKTKLVLTRHPCPPQRRPNKHWRSAK